jgi:hypothetical protein
MVSNEIVFAEHAFSLSRENSIKGTKISISPNCDKIKNSNSYALEKECN